MNQKAVKMLSAAHTTARTELGEEHPTTKEIEGHFKRKKISLGNASGQPRQTANRARNAPSAPSVRHQVASMQSMRPVPPGSGRSSTLKSARPASAASRAATPGGARMHQTYDGRSLLRPVSAHASPRQPRPLSATARARSARRPTSAPAHHLGTPGTMAMRPRSAHTPVGGSRGGGAGGAPAISGLERQACDAERDPHLERSYWSALHTLKHQSEQERLVSPAFLQTVNDCAQHYYFTNSNAQYRAGPQALHSPR